jgi:hypothetical protein
MFDPRGKPELLKGNWTANEVKRCLAKVRSMWEREYPRAVTPVQVSNSPSSSQASSQERTPLSLLDRNQRSLKRMFNDIDNSNLIRMFRFVLVPPLVARGRLSGSSMI